MTTRIDSALLALIPALTLPQSQTSALLRRLDVDQRLQGRVLAVRGSQVLISLLGEQIEAESLLPFTVGQALTLVVREVGPDRITLRVAPEAEAEAPVLHVLSDQDLSQLLAAQHLPADSTNLLMARALIRNALPVTSALVLEIRQALSFIEAPTAQDVDAAIYLLFKELPVTPQSLELAKGGLPQPNTLGATAQHLAAQLIELLAQPEQDRVATMLPRPLLTLAHQVLQGLPQLVPDQAQGQALAALLRQVVDQIATPTEHRLARLLEAAGFVPSDRETQPAAAAPIPDPLLSQEPHQGLPAVTTHQLDEVPRDLRQQLALLSDELAQAAADLPTRHAAAPLLHELQGTIREMLTMVEAGQLSNAGMPQPTQAQGYHLFHLPVAAAGQDTTDTAELRIYYQRRDQSKRVDPENAHLAFLLQMSHLGPVDLHVDLYQKHLRCRIDCSSPEAAELFQESAHELHERLQEIGYAVDSIRTAIASRPTGRLEQASEPNLFKIDLRA